MQARQLGFRVLFALAGTLLAAPALHAQQARDGTVAKLVEMKGNVLVSRESGLATGNEAARVVANSRVITTANSNVVVEYDNGCRVRLEENQRFEVEVGKPCAALIAQNLFVAPAAGVITASTVVPAIAGLAGAALIYDTRKQPPVSPN